jgi:hypothetical protein
VRNGRDQTRPAQAIETSSSELTQRNPLAFTKCERLEGTGIPVDALGRDPRPPSPLDRLIHATTIGPVGTNAASSRPSRMLLTASPATRNVAATVRLPGNGSALATSPALSTRQHKSGMESCQESQPQYSTPDLCGRVLRAILGAKTLARSPRKVVV